MWSSLLNATTTQSTRLPGTTTSLGASDPAAAIRSTWAITSPPEFFAAMAIGSMSRVSASRSMVMLPQAVGRRAADQRHVDGHGMIEQPFFALAVP